MEGPCSKAQGSFGGNVSCSDSIQVGSWRSLGSILAVSAMLPDGQGDCKGKLDINLWGLGRAVPLAGIPMDEQQ